MEIKNIDQEILEAADNILDYAIKNNFANEFILALRMKQLINLDAEGI